MKKLLILTLALFITIFTQISTSYAAVNDFVITNYDIDYKLTRDSENRSLLTTTEKITAQFPSTDQNHGIERYIPKDYDKHPVSTDIISVTNAQGSAWNYTTYDSGAYQILRVGDKNSYVHGEQTYVVTYKQRDVTKYFANTKSDEFYWDTTGTEWRVSIEKLSVTLTVDEKLKSALNGNQACYQGAYGSTRKCELTKNEVTYTAEAQDLAPGQNITLAVGFRPDTFSQYQVSMWEVMLISWVFLQVVVGFIALGVIIIWLSVRYYKVSGRKNDIGTIVPEYIPHPDSSVPIAATLLNSTTSFSAFIVDMAVRHYVRLIEIKPKSTWSNAEYEIEIIKPIDSLRYEEKEIIQDIFQSTAVGSKVNTKSLQKDYGLYSRVSDNTKKLSDLIRGQYGLRAKDPTQTRWFRRFAFISLVAAIILLLSPPLLIAALVAYTMSFTLWPLTDKGLILYRYLEGLKMYIGVAETDRLKMLQSPEGAQKVAIDSTDQGQLVKLYERVLPYAILFGQEKEWNKQLGQYYEASGTQPDWYTGTHMAAFNAAAFSSAMSNLTSSVSSTGAASSSSGGSSGGGSSGGGGGGGGGGGW